MNNRNLMLALAGTMVLAACDQPDDTNRVVGEMASDRIELTAEVSEPIVEILVSEGEIVQQGQLLLRQDNSRALASTLEAEASLGQVQARLDELVRGPRSEQITAARANLEGATRSREFHETEYERAQKVHAMDLASPDTLDKAKAALDAAGAGLNLRRAQLQELLSGTTVEELAQAEQAVVQAQARLDFLTIDLARHDLRAPVDGVADTRLFELGERPAREKVMLIVLSGKQSHARVYVPESLRVLVTPGTPALIHVDGLADAIQGRVRWVSSDAAFTPYFALTERDRGRLSYLAKVDIAEDIPRLPDGVPVEVELLIGSADLIMLTDER
jgi:HlyD family secretion protein